jgi:hypothetical protein
MPISSDAKTSLNFQVNFSVKTITGGVIMLIIKLVQHEKKYIWSYDGPWDHTTHFIFQSVMTPLIGYVQDRCPTFQNNLFKMNTSRWFKYFTVWDVYNTWDCSQYRQNNYEEGKWINHTFGVFLLNPEEIGGAWGSVVCTALCYLSEGLGIDSQWCRWGFFPKLPTELCALGSTQPLKMSTRLLLEVKTAGA